MPNEFTSGYGFGKIGTCHEVPTDAMTNPDHPLTAVQIHDWATIESGLSHGFATGTIPPSSQFTDGRHYIGEVMNSLDHTFLHTFTDLNSDYLKEGGFREIFRRKIEDPGMLRHAVYFDVDNRLAPPSFDPTSVSFYWHVWHGNMAKAMDFLHGFSWDLDGKCRRIEPSTIWHHINSIEGMALSERKKISDYAFRVRKMTADLKRLPKITCFGGGNLPERHYGLPEAEITVFDNGERSPLDQLFPNPVARSRVRYITDDLLTAIEHPELFGTQDIVSMFGVVQSIGETATVQAISFGEELLRDKGIFAFDLLVMNESLRRFLWTQCSHTEANSNMAIFNSASEAMTVGMNIINTVNERLEQKHVIFTAEPPIVTKIGAWGATGVRFYLKKHVL